MLNTVKERLSACLVSTKISMTHSHWVLSAKSPQLPEDYSRQMQVTHCFSPHTTHKFFIFLTFYGVAKVIFSVMSVCYWQLVAINADLFKRIHLRTPHQYWHIVPTETCTVAKQMEFILLQGFFVIKETSNFRPVRAHCKQ